MSRLNQSRLSINKQSGFTMWSFIFTSAVVLFAVYIIALLIPAYSADSSIENSLNQSMEKLSVQEIKKAKILLNLDRDLNLDGFYNVPDLSESVEIIKSREGAEVVVAYKKEIPLFFNIGMYLDFKHEVQK